MPCTHTTKWTRNIDTFVFAYAPHDVARSYAENTATTRKHVRTTKADAHP